MKIKCLVMVVLIGVFIQPAWSGKADVVNVVITPVSSGQYRIEVTLQHEDAGWDHYANAWQVLDLQGNVIGERVLYHPHVNEQPFTRSLTLSIPEPIQQVLIRGKDSVHGDGGHTMIVDVPR